MRKIIPVLVFVLILLLGCTQSTKEGSPKTGLSKATDDAISNTSSPPSFQKGISLSPRSFQSADFTEFFNNAKQTGTAVTWTGDLDELGKENSGPNVVATLASTYNYTPIIIATIFTQSDGKLIRPLDESTKKRYVEEAVAFAGKYKPTYLGLGIEVNMLYEKSPGNFNEFASFYSEAYDAIKTASPNTKVFTVFQLERMKGMQGGLFGGTNDPTKTEWALLNEFTKSDIIAFTTYPGLVYKNPSDIPSDYYTEIKLHTAKPIAFTEIGWHSSASPTDWESSYEEQAKFISAFFTLSKDTGKELAIWSFMYDPNTFEPFNSMGLRSSDGNAKPAWGVWVTGQ